MKLSTQFTTRTPSMEQHRSSEPSSISASMLLLTGSLMVSQPRSEANVRAVSRGSPDLNSPERRFISTLPVPLNLASPLAPK